MLLRLSKITKMHKSINIKRMCTNKLQYISDMHLEYRENFPIIPAKCNNLALLGDIGNPFKKNYLDFIKYASNNWNDVFVISGNHEYWQENYNIDDVNDKIEDIVSNFKNVHFLNNGTCEMDDYMVIGSTLWSKIQKKPVSIMGDDMYIRFEIRVITYEDINKLHDHSVEWITNAIEKSNKKIIVLTHHLPSYELIADIYKVGRYAKYHDRFASNLDHLIKYPVKIWLCGHSHITLETNINDVFLGINAYGYNRESIIKKENDIIRLVNLE